MGQHFSHLTKTKRIQLDAFVRAGMKPKDIAKELGVHKSTIYRELKRATYEHLNSDYTTETRYNPDEADRLYREHLRAKGPDIKLGNDYELADYLVTKIRDEKYSPEAAVGEATVAGWPFKVRICASTVYNYIRGEVFGDDLTAEMLPQQGKRQPARKDVDHTPARAPAGKSIEERPKIVDTRTTFGHWEMDCIESCEGVNAVWLMMTERMTRHEIIVPMKDQTSASVIRALNGIERKLGAMFPKIFVSITCDNGSEFADAEGIERKRRGKGKRTEVYYCHPRTPNERGSNERQNGMARRLVPKGTDLSKVPPAEVKRIEDWLNRYPRKMFGFLCSEYLFRAQVMALLAG